ncbi:sporulation integral membrane protein YtvI [Bacillus sinesaloumensis]|uniref:sporulation integral membrane protein YtvI n=1 Tax=Litchfieldia sinesaloumensis TaxID=1926280 RepID=UPI000988429C|nr:sporulation integral membrane protein YtvI [Bacillus sinesaloumensis]
MVKKYINKRNILLVIAAGVLLYLLPMSISLILAFLTALLLEPVVNLLITKYRFKRIYSVTVTFVVFMVFVLFLAYLLINVIINQLITIVKNIPFYISSIDTDQIMETFQKFETYFEGLPKEVMDSIMNTLYSFQDLLIVAARNITEGTFSFVSSLPELLLELIVYLVAAFLFMNDFPAIKNKFKAMLQDSSIEKMKIVTTQLKKIFVGFIKAQIVLSGVTFVITYVGLWILDVNYLIIISLLIVLVDLLPILGTGSFIVPWAIFVLINGNTKLGIGLLILFILITVIRKIIEPKVYSQNFGISALAALISMYLGFKIIGIIGLLLGPLLVILYDSLTKAGVINLGLKSNKI